MIFYEYKLIDISIMKKLLCPLAAMIGIIFAASCAKVDIETQDYKIQKEGNAVLLYNNMESLSINLHQATLLNNPSLSDTLSASDVVVLQGLRCRISDIKEIDIVKTIRNVIIIEKEFTVELLIPLRNDKIEDRIQTTFSFSREVLGKNTGKRTEEYFCGFQFKVTPRLVGYIQDLKCQEPYCIAEYEFDVELLENTKSVGTFNFKRSFAVKNHEISFLPTVEDWEAAQTGTINC